MANSFLSSISSFFNGKPNSSNVVSGRRDVINAMLINQYSGAKNIDVDLKKAELISTVFTCVKVLSENVSRLPLTINQDNGKNKLPLIKHKYYNQLKFNPQQWVNTKDWLTSIIACLYLRGNAYAYIDPTGQFKIMNPDSVDLGIYQGELWYWNEDLSLPLRPEELLHFRLLTKDPLAKGFNPIESLKVELNIQSKAEATVNNFYSNNAHSTKYVQQVGDLGKTNNTKLAEIIEDFQTKYGGFDNSGNMIVIPPNFELKELKISADDMAFLESAKYSESSIASLMGVPLYLLGKNDPTGKYEESSLYFRNNTLASLINVIKSELEFKLLTVDERNNGVSIDFDINAILDTNLLDKSTIYKSIAQQGALSPNEFRRAFNIPVSNNPALDNYYIQSQYVILDNVANGTAKPAAPQNNTSPAMDNSNNN